MNDQIISIQIFRERVSTACMDDDFEKREMQLKQFVVDKSSPFVGHTILECGIRNQFHCLVVGIESAGDVSLHAPDVHIPLQAGDVMWVVGEETNLQGLCQWKEHDLAKEPV